MTAWEIAGLGVAAVTVFWMLGAYNRLVSLRNRVGAAWRVVDDLLALRATAVESLLEALREPLAGEGAALDALAAAQARVTEAAHAMRAQSASAVATSAMARADAALGPACTRVLALTEAEGSLRTAEAVQAPMTALRELAPRLAFARQAFNDAVQAHNDAIAQWPTRVLVRLYGFVPGAML